MGSVYQQDGEGRAEDAIGKGAVIFCQRAQASKQHAGCRDPGEQIPQPHSPASFSID